MAQGRGRSFFSQITWVERLFGIFLLIAFTGLPRRFGPGVFLSTWALVYCLGTFALLRRGLALARQQIWWLRKRLVVAYLFIAVVPIVLIGVLAEMAAYTLASQVGIYLLSSEVDRKIEVLKQSAHALARVPASARPEALRRAGLLYR